MKRIGLILLISGFVSLFCFGQKTDTTIYIHPDIEPTFKYDTCTSLTSSVKEYFVDNYKMPKLLLDNGYVGKVYVEFVIEKDGSLSNIKLVQGIDKPLDKTVVETVKSMQKWIPGINNEKTVRTKFVLPISIHWLYGKD
nr:energy transducer TonB [uncultured Draconibacterium sp.]